MVENGHQIPRPQAESCDSTSDPTPDLRVIRELDPDFKGPYRAPRAGRSAQRLHPAIAAGQATADSIGFSLGWLALSTGSIHWYFVIPAALLWLSLLSLAGLYRTHLLSAHDELRRVVGTTAIGALLLAIAAPDVTVAAGRLRFGIACLLWVGGAAVNRSATRSVINRLRLSGRLAYRTLIVGTDEAAVRLTHRLAQPGSGYVPVGRVAVEGQSAADDALAIIGTTEYLVTTIQRSGADCLFVSSTPLDHAELITVRTIARRHGVELRFAVDLPESLESRFTVQSIGDVTAVALRPARLTIAQAAAKRGLDLIVGSVTLVLALPVMILITAAVKLTSRGPVLFRQVRVTHGGRRFTMYKFRTMVREADRLLDENNTDRSTAFFKMREGAPLTPIGSFLRRLSLDELPQLINVVRGDMSLVGPRPLPVEQVEANLDLLGPRHEVRAGLTGWWQVSGRSDVDPEGAVKLDVLYIENWSLSLDLFILFKTLRAVLLPKGAF